MRPCLGLLLALALLGCDARDDVEAANGSIELDVDELVSNITDVDDGGRVITITAREHRTCSIESFEFIVVTLAIDDLSAVPRDTTIDLLPEAGPVRATIGFGRENCALVPAPATGTVTFTRLGQLAAQGDLSVRKADSYDSYSGCGGTEVTLNWEEFEVPLDLGGCN